MRRRRGNFVFVLMFVLGGASRELDLEAALINLQLRSGLLSSFKTTTLARSPWELGPMEEVAEREEIGFYRIIGSPLPPRHNESQLWDNLKYLIHAEPPLERAKKIFVLNRLEPTLNSEVRDFIEKNGHEAVSLPFDFDEYKPFQMDDTYGLTKEMWNPYLTDKFARMNARLYVMNNNGARNFALRDGLRRGWSWTLPFDGNCIFDTTTWRQFLSDLDDAKANEKAYVAIPLMRTLLNPANNTLVRNGAPGEHQVAFNKHAKLQFDPTQPYGHRPKVNLLWRLGVPGSWDKWSRDAPFRSDGPCVITSHHDCVRTLPYMNPTEAKQTVASKTVVYRLPDGLVKPGNNGEDITALRGRGELRDLGTIRKISQVDQLRPMTNVKTFVKPTYFNVVSMETMRRECAVTNLMFKPFRPLQASSQQPLIGAVDQHHCSQIDDLQKLADKHLYDDVYTVVDKARSPAYDPPEGASIHDYQRLGLYDWRIKELPMNINVSDLRIPPVLAGVRNMDLHDPEWRAAHANVFVGWDGHGRNGADIWAEGSEAFDRTRSFDMMSNLTLMSLAYFYTGKDEYAEKATRIARTWFIDPKTAQSPNMNYAQFSKRPEKAHFGVIATKDLAYTFDALWLVTPTKFWTEQDDEILKTWCHEYFQWLNNSNERKSPNNHGWYYLTQYIAVAQCAGKPSDFILRKLSDHVTKYVTEPYITKDGIFTLEAERSRGVHYHFFTFYAIILAWRALSNLGARDLMAHMSTTLRPTLTYLDAIVTNATTDTCLSYDDEFGGVSPQQYQQRHGSGGPTITGCVTAAVALEYAAPVCQWAFDDDAAFAETLAICKSHGPGSRPGPFLGTPALNNYVMPPFIPTFPHMGYFPFTNLMW